MLFALIDPMADIVRPIVSIVAVGAVSIVMLIIALRVIGKALPFDVHHEIEEDHNTAAAIVMASVVIGVALVIAAVARA
ncbi:MAG: DUF350 domain-containing protein [Planctomycetota bacterium]